MDRITNKLQTFLIICEEKNRKQLLEKERQKIRMTNQIIMNQSKVSFFFLLSLGIWKLFLPIESFLFIFCTVVSYIILLERMMSLTLQLIGILGIIYNQRPSISLLGATTEKEQKKLRKLSDYLKLSQFNSAVMINTVSSFLFIVFLFVQVYFSVLSTNTLFAFYLILVMILFIFFVVAVSWSLRIVNRRDILNVKSMIWFNAFFIILQWLLVLVCCSVYFVFQQLFFSYEGVGLIFIFAVWAISLFRKAYKLWKN